MRYSAILLLFCGLITPAHASAESDTPFAFPSASVLRSRSGQGRAHLPSTNAIQKNVRKSRDKLSRFHPDRVPVQSFPKIPPRPAAHIDFNEVIRNAGKAKRILTHPKDHSPRLLVFVSFSMPRKSLQRLAMQAGLAHAAVMLRGLVSDAKGKPSFHATGIAVGKLELKKGQGFSVSPMAFKKYGISQVPAFVLVTGKICTTCGMNFIPKHMRLFGDVSLGYALRAMALRHPGQSERIKPYLTRLKTGFFESAPGGRSK